VDEGGAVWVLSGDDGSIVWPGVCIGEGMLTKLDCGCSSADWGQGKPPIRLLTADNNIFRRAEGDGACRFFLWPEVDCAAVCSMEVPGGDWTAVGAISAGEVVTGWGVNCMEPHQEGGVGVLERRTETEADSMGIAEGGGVTDAPSGSGDTGGML